MADELVPDDVIATDAAPIEIEVACGTTERQVVRGVTVPSGTTAREAVRLSGIAADFPELDLETLELGVYGNRVEPGASVKAGDRVEILRPLSVDPREARRQRVAQKRSQR